MIPRRRGGSRLAISTVYRWVQVGVRGVKLEYLQIGGMKVTTVAALQRFFERLTGDKPETPTAKSRQRQREIARAERELKATGYRI